MSAPEGVDPVAALDLALERIAEIGHAPGCSGAFPPFRCKCRLAEDLAVIRSARYGAVPGPDPLSEEERAWVERMREMYPRLHNPSVRADGRAFLAIIDRLAPDPEKE